MNFQLCKSHIFSVISLYLSLLFLTYIVELFFQLFHESKSRQIQISESIETQPSNRQLLGAHFRSRKKSDSEKTPKVTFPISNFYMHSNFSWEQKRVISDVIAIEKNRIGFEKKSEQLRRFESPATVQKKYKIKNCRLWNKCWKNFVFDQDEVFTRFFENRD